MKEKIFAFSSIVLAAAALAESEIDVAIGKGAEYLLSVQSTDGHWSDPHMPALTALPVWALSSSGIAAECCGKAVSKGVEFVLGTQREDGGFYVPKPGRGGSGLGNYNTSVCLSALFVSGKSPAGPLLKAREYIASSQLVGDDTMAGGFGYDKVSRRRYADLSNTSYALDAMRRTERLEEFRGGGKRVDVDWDKALSFVENLVSKSGDDAGGAAYNERTPHGGVSTNASGKVSLRSYGSMTYAAVLSMCHANLDRSDPRVKQTLSYCAAHWSVDENPGMGSQGLYYFFDIMARALSASGVDEVGGHAWKKELAAKIVSLQRPDGSWANDNNRFWESDKTLCTSFAMLALGLCREKEAAPPTSRLPPAAGDR
jgi:squalene-hopene/tetraprenyl-beta-curcumene cyclase